MPLKIKATAEGTFDPDGDKLTYTWDFGDGEKTETNTSYVEHTFNEAGTYAVSLSVSDEHGATSRSPQISVYAGNSRPQVKIEVAGNSSFYFPNTPVKYEVTGKDNEEGELKDTDLQSRGYIKAEYLESSDKAALHTATSGGMETSLPGKAIMESLDCVACHKINETSIGPSYKEMAKHYKDNVDAINFLPQTILKGGSGNWGDMTMAAHPDLPLSDAKEIVTWILSLAKEDAKEQSMPMSGSFVPSEKFQLQPQGDIVLSASYADKGYNQMPSLTTVENLILRNPSLKFEDAETSPEVSNITMGGKQIKLINTENSWIKFSQISLKDVNSIQVNYGMGEITNAGWKLEIRLGNPDGELIGEEILGIGKEAREPSEAVVMIKKDIEEKKLLDVYFVFSRKDMEEQGGIWIIELLLKAE